MGKKKKNGMFVLFCVLFGLILTSFFNPPGIGNFDRIIPLKISNNSPGNLIDGRHYSPIYYDGYFINGLETTRGIQTYLSWDGNYKPEKEREIKYSNQTYIDPNDNKTYVKYDIDAGRFKVEFTNFTNKITTSRFSFKQRPSEIGLYNWNTETYINKENVSKADEIIPDVQNKSLTYTEIFTNTDVKFTSNGSHIKEVFINDGTVFWGYPGGWTPSDTYLVIFTELYDFNGVNLYDNDGKINQSKVINGVIKLKSTELGEELLAYLPLGQAWAKFSDNEIHYTDVKSRIIFRDNDIYYASAIDYRFVVHAQRTGKLFIDPTWTIGKEGDAWADCDFYQTMENKTTNYAQLYPNNSSGYIISPIEKAKLQWLRIQYEGILNAGSIDIYWNGSKNKENWKLDLVKINAQPNANYYLPNPSKYGKWKFILHGSISPFKTPEIYNVTVFNDPPNFNDFNYYKEIEINSSKVMGLSAHVNFPILININDSDLQSNTQSDGDDIAFSNFTHWLDHEIEYYNGSVSNNLIAWVRIPSLNPLVDTTIYMYYGNSTMGNQQNPTGVWKSDYKAIYHLSEDPTGTTYDSTSNDKDGTPQNMESGDQKAGKIDGSLHFDGSTSEYDDIPYTNLGSSLTYSFWFRFLGGDGDSDDTLRFMGGLIKFSDTWNYIRWYPDVYASKTEVSYSFPDTNWHYFTVFQSGTTCSIYVDDSELADDVSCSAIRTNHDYSDFGYDFDGYLDEVRISTEDFYDGWVLTEYNNQYDPGSFYSIGEQTETGEIPYVPPIYPVILPDPILSTIILFTFMGIMIYLYVKMRIFYLILLVFLFSLVLGGISVLQFEIPFSPYLQVFFLLFQTVFFVLTALETFEKR